MLHFSNSVKALKPELFEEIVTYTLSKLKSTTNNHDESDFILRDQLFNVYVKWGRYSDAAQTLAGLNLESTIKVYSDLEKANIHVQCAGKSRESYLPWTSFENERSIQNFL